MAQKMEAKQFFTLFVICQLTGFFAKGLGPICCLPDQWEVNVIGDEGLADLPSNYGYGFSNATMRAVYDYTNNRTYIREDSLSFMSIFPWYPIVLRDIYILDYANNVQYHVYNDSSCDKGVIDEQLFKQCVPGNATRFAEGTIGGPGSSLKTKSYFFLNRIYLDPYQMTITVAHTDAFSEVCVPVHLTVSQSYVYDDPKNVDISSVTYTDFTTKISDPSIFTPPKNCTDQSLKAKEEMKKPKLAQNIFKMMNRL